MRTGWIINLLALLLVVPACNNSSPAAPTPAIPDVAGAYSGPLALTVAVDPDNMQTLNGTMRLVATQSGAQVTLNATTTIFGATEALPPTVGMINEDGEFTFSDDFEGMMTDPECGESRRTRMTLVFMDGTAVFEQAIETTDCGNFAIAASMTKE